MINGHPAELIQAMGLPPGIYSSPEGQGGNAASEPHHRTTSDATKLSGHSWANRDLWGRLLRVTEQEDSPLMSLDYPELWRQTVHNQASGLS